MDATFARHTARFLQRRELKLPGLDGGWQRSEAEGVLDLERCRYEIKEGMWAAIVDHGQKYLSEADGRWVCVPPIHGAPPIWGEPLWMLQLIRGVVATSSAAPERYICDCIVADERSPSGMAPPRGLPLRAMRAIDVTVSLSSDGLIAASDFTLPASRAHLQLYDFDEAPGVELPPEELLTDWLPPEWRP